MYLHIAVLWHTMIHNAMLHTQTLYIYSGHHAWMGLKDYMQDYMLHNLFVVAKHTCAAQNNTLKQKPKGVYHTKWEWTQTSLNTSTHVLHLHLGHACMFTSIYEASGFVALAHTALARTGRAAAPLQLCIMHAGDHRHPPGVGVHKT